MWLTQRKSRIPGGSDSFRAPVYICIFIVGVCLAGLAFKLYLAKHFLNGFPWFETQSRVPSILWGRPHAPRNVST